MSAITHNPEWNDQSQKRAAYRSRRDWSLRWWAMLAIIASFVFHGMLYVTVNITGLGMADKKETARQPLERVKINPELLQNQQAVQEIPEVIAPSGKPEIQAFEPKLDDFDKQAMLPKNQEIDLTPNVKEITNFIRKDDPGDMAPAKAQMEAMAQALAPESLSTPDLAQEMASVRQSISKPVSTNQMLINAGSLEPEEQGKIDMGLLNQMNRQGQGAADAASKRVKGFSNLDDLLGGGGQVGGSTAPILMPTDLLFEYGSDQLAEGARLSLMKLGFLIQKNPDSLFIIEGHTDTFGTEEYNLNLSQRRANAVVEWLIQSLRLTTDRVRAVGMGESALIVTRPSATIEEQGINRRVEIKVRARR